MVSDSGLVIVLRHARIEYNVNVNKIHIVILLMIGDDWFAPEDRLHDRRKLRPGSDLAVAELESIDKRSRTCGWWGVIIRTAY